MLADALHRLPAPLRAWLLPAPDSEVAGTLRQGKSPWVDAIHLLWSAWIFIVPSFGGGYTARWALLTAASYPVFLLLYARALLAPRRSASRYALAMCVLALVLLPLRYYAGLSYFIFGCVMLGIGQSWPLARYLGWLVGLNAVALTLLWAVGYPVQAFVWLPVTTFIIGMIIKVQRINEQKDAALRLSHEEVRRLAATAERERIGRDLHDLLGHTLSLITLKLELARKLSARDPARSRRELEEAERVAREALVEVRSAVTGIRSTGLAAELASARLMLESLQVHFDYDLPPEGLPPPLEGGLALVLREAVTNIARHAQATRVRVGLVRDARAMQLAVEDDGRGGIAVEGNGIAGMRDRVRALGGTLSIDSPCAGGTRLLARVPLGAGAFAVADAAAMPDAGHQAPRPAAGDAAGEAADEATPAAKAAR